MRSRLLASLAILLFTAWVVACNQQATSNETEEQSAATPVTLAMGFIPNVQFAPFYVAHAKGYYAEEGIDLTFDYGMENDLVQLVAADELRFAIASGDQVILGRSQGLPVVYVMEWYRRYPVAVTSITLDLQHPKDLEGHTLGLPGLFGANYIGWLAMAYAADVDQDRVHLEAIGFNQVPALIDGQVDAAMVYATNEPLQLKLQGYDPKTLYVSDYIDLVSNGLITNEKSIETRSELVEGMVRASLRGLADTLANPDEAFDIVVKEYVPEAGGENAEIQRAVLEEALSFWQSETLGASRPEAWQASVEFMAAAGLIDTTPNVETLFTNQFVDTASVSLRR